MAAVFQALTFATNSATYLDFSSHPRIPQLILRLIFLLKVWVTDIHIYFSYNFDFNEIQKLLRKLVTLYDVNRDENLTIPIIGSTNYLVKMLYNLSVNKCFYKIRNKRFVTIIISFKQLNNMTINSCPLSFKYINYHSNKIDSERWWNRTLLPNTILSVWRMSKRHSINVVSNMW